MGSKNIFILFCLISIFSACTVSLKNASIAPEIQSFWVDKFSVTARNVPPAIEIDFAEALIDKFQNESRLEINEADPDIVYSGIISSYRVTFIDPKPDQTVSLNRLNVTIQIKYKNNQDEEKNWEQSFSDYAEFEPDQVLNDIQEELLDKIFLQITEDIFNKSFGDW